MDKAAQGGAYRAIAVAVAETGGCNVSQLGLRFDRVVVRLLDELALAVEAGAPEGVSVILTLTAPVRMPRRTVRALQQEVATLLAVGGDGSPRDRTVFENQAELRLLEHGRKNAPKLLGFVHDSSVHAAQIDRLAEQWLRAGA